jgi:hypothetical protein
MSKKPPKISDALQRELDVMVCYNVNEPRQKLSEIIDSRIIIGYSIGRRCIGSKQAWVDKEKIDVPIYKETRWVINFTDGLSLNVDRKVFNYYRGEKKVKYFGFYD